MIGKPFPPGHGPGSGNHDRASGNAIGFDRRMRAEAPSGLVLARLRGKRFALSLPRSFSGDAGQVD